MPEYNYTDGVGHNETISHSFDMCGGEIVCWCGLQMWRKPTNKAVNWGGLKPSLSERSPEIQNHIDTAEQQREDYERMKDD